MGLWGSLAILLGLGPGDPGSNPGSPSLFMKELLFIYGTLKSKNIQDEVIGEEPKEKKDILENHIFSGIKIDGKTFLVVTPKENSSVDGFVIEVTSEELKKIDKYEGKEYIRRKVKLKSGVVTWVYMER